MVHSGKQGYTPANEYSNRQFTILNVFSRKKGRFSMIFHCYVSLSGCNSTIPLRFNISKLLVCFIHQHFKFIRCPRARGHREGRGHVITEGAIVRMFHDGHQLNTSTSWAEKNPMKKIPSKNIHQKSVNWWNL